MLLASAAHAADLPDACDAPADRFTLNAGAEIATDYIYRGVTLSAHAPALGANVEVDRGPFYFSFAPHSVNLPSNAAAELATGAGWCRAFGAFKLDLGAAYLTYPRELGASNYGEAHGTLAWERDWFTLSASYAYSPNYAATGAREHYLEGGLALHIGKFAPLAGVDDWSLTATAGRSWFAPILPDYFNWSLGVSFDRGPYTFGVAYSRTDLDRERCAVFAGAPRWCGPALVGSFSYQLP